MGVIGKGAYAIRQLEEVGRIERGLIDIAGTVIEWTRDPSLQPSAEQTGRKFAEYDAGVAALRAAALEVPTVAELIALNPPDPEPEV